MRRKIRFKYTGNLFTIISKWKFVDLVIFENAKNDHFVKTFLIYQQSIVYANSCITNECKSCLDGNFVTITIPYGSWWWIHYQFEFKNQEHAAMFMKGTSA
jgi:hypothetical protein